MAFTLNDVVLVCIVVALVTVAVLWTREADRPRAVITTNKNTLLANIEIHAPGGKDGSDGWATVSVPDGADTKMYGVKLSGPGGSNAIGDGGKGGIAALVSRYAFLYSEDTEFCGAHGGDGVQRGGDGGAGIGVEGVAKLAAVEVVTEVMVLCAGVKEATALCLVVVLR